MQDVPLQHLVIDSISCIPCSTGKIYQMQAPLWSKSMNCTVVRKWSQEMWHPEGGIRAGIEGSQLCTDLLPPFPCRCSTWVTSPLEHPLRNSGFSLIQARLTCGCPLCCAPADSVVSTDNPHPDHLSLALPLRFAPLAPGDTYLLCLQLHMFCSDILSLPPTSQPIRPSSSITFLGGWRELLLVTPFG